MIRALGERKPVFEGGGHFIAETATIIGSVQLGDCSSVWFNSVLRGDNDWLVVGERSNVQDGCVLHTDPGMPLTIGEGVTIGHKVMLHGCSIGRNTLIGIGSTLLNGSKIGVNCIVGAHALITENKEFPDGCLILGSPARVVRELEPEEIAKIGLAADTYVANARRFNEQLATPADADPSAASCDPGPRP